MSTSTLYLATIYHLLLEEDIHDGSADLHSYTVLLEHVKKRQETLLEGRGKKATLKNTLEPSFNKKAFNRLRSLGPTHNWEQDREVVEV